MSLGRKLQNGGTCLGASMLGEHGGCACLLERVEVAERELAVAVGRAEKAEHALAKAVDAVEAYHGEAEPESSPDECAACIAIREGREVLASVSRDAPPTECGCAYEDVPDGSVTRRRWFHDPDCPRGGAPPTGDDR
jgi:hypothetical protein